MKLYHFTAISYLPSILRTGINRGEIPLSATEVLNGSNLTSDPSGRGHGLSSARFFTKEELRFLGGRVRDGAPLQIVGNKRKVRITVDVANESVFRWLRWSKTNVTPQFRDLLIKSGGGLAKAKTWYVLFQPVLPSQFSAVELFEDGRWVDYQDYTGPIEEVFTDAAIERGFREWGDQIFCGLSDTQKQRFEASFERFASAAVRESLPEAEEAYPKQQFAAEL